MISKESVFVAAALIGMVGPMRAQITMPAPPPGKIVALTADVTVITSLSSQLGATAQTQTGKYYRSSDGKTRQDTATVSTIFDPTARTVVSLNLARQQASISYLPLPAAPSGQSAPASGQSPLVSSQNPPAGSTSQNPQTLSEALGQATISGQAATGTRITRSNPLGLKVGVIVTEVWTADEIGLPVLMTQTAPGAETTQKFENIQLGEPDPQLFVIPAGYNVQQATPAPSN
jgi:hypothetical protein